MAKKTYQVGELATYFNVTRDTIRYYDKVGILRPQEVSENGYRIYTRDDFIRMEYIMQLKQLGMPLDSIKDVVRGSSIEEAAAIISIQAAEVERQIEELKNLQSMIETYKSSYQSAIESKGEVIIKEIPEMLYIPMKNSLRESRGDFAALTGKHVPKFTFVMKKDDYIEKRYGDLQIQESRQNFFSYAITVENDLGLSAVPAEVGEPKMPKMTGKSEGLANPDEAENAFQIIPRRRCAYSIIKCYTDESYADFEKCRNHILEQGYKITGDVYLRLLYLRSYKVTYYEFMAPIE